MNVNLNSFNFDRFLTSLHRRLIVVRTLERVGLCLLVACLAAIVLSPILIWRGESAVTLIFVCATMGLLAGLVWGIAQCPRLLDVAIEADRQLDLADLLSTVVSTRLEETDLTTPGWRRTLLALAEDRCRTLAPATVVLNRYGARTWGGIGLAAAMTLTLALVSTRPELIRADDRPDRVSRVIAERSPIEQNEPILAPGRSESRVFSQLDSRENGSRDFDLKAETSDDSSKRNHLGLDNGSSASGQDGAGAGAGSTEVDDHQRRGESAAGRRILARSGDGQRSSGLGTTSADLGTGEVEADSATVAPIIGQPKSHPPSGTAALPSGSNFNASSRTAGVPDAYRDLVRDYFSDDR